MYNCATSTLAHRKKMEFPEVQDMAYFPIEFPEDMAFLETIKFSRHVQDIEKESKYTISWISGNL